MVSSHYFALNEEASSIKIFFFFEDSSIKMLFTIILRTFIT
ncbi:hypothetical protein MtrunA17_Chr3g0112911 [Medicago truncatula]|uniref:Uncharacterized protein n=1 Tax=Medicago truncatula TaxID=3880 RepID=A0A396IRH5_MEDTR|nr:hypothetical protein MtrunA17_Chr3g0112911 [Medicago truncatula]